MFEKTIVRGVMVVAALALTSLSGVCAGTFQFTDGFEGSTLDPFWNNAFQQSGYITFPSAAAAHSGSQCVQFNSTNTANDKEVVLSHSFPGMMYGDVSVWFYDTGTGQDSANYIALA